MHDAILRTGFLFQTRGYLRLIGIAVRDTYVHVRIGYTTPLCTGVCSGESPFAVRFTCNCQETRVSPCQSSFLILV